MKKRDMRSWDDLKDWEQERRQVEAWERTRPAVAKFAAEYNREEDIREELLMLSWDFMLSRY